MKRCTTTLVIILSAAAAGAAAVENPAAPRLVADIRPEARPPAGSEPRWLAPGRDLLYFAAADGFSGVELWATAGAPAAPYRVADVCPGPCSSSPAWITAAGGRLYFLAFEPAHGHELWTSDGTADGTRLLVEVEPGPTPEREYGTYLGPFLAIGERLFFVARQGRGYALWTSDGTPAGTVPLASFLDAIDPPRLLGAAGGMAFFIGHDAPHGHELWRSDGTADGTRLVADIRPGRESADVAQPFATAVSFRGRLYFAADDGRRGRELWSSDGTADGTRLVRDLTPGRGHSYPQWLVASPGGVYLLAARGGGNRLELWRTDGSAAGTRLLHSPFPHLEPGAVLGDSLVFPALVLNRGVELWITNGASEMRLLRRWTNPPHGGGDLTLLARLGRVLFFQVVSGGLQGIGIELWRTDGTPQGTVPVTALEQGVFLTTFKGKAYFAGSTRYEHELWTSDGTRAGTGLFADLHPGDRSSSPRQLTDLGGALLFAADDGEHGPEMWRSDGTPGGTATLGDLTPPPLADETPRVLGRLGDRLLFGSYVYEPDGRGVEGALWSTAGGPGDAQLLRDDVGAVHGGWLLGDRLLFFAVTGDAERYEWVLRLWRTDGTAAGTEQVAEVGKTAMDGPDGSIPPPEIREAVTAAGSLYFFFCDHLWRSDGTPAGTAEKVWLRDLCRGACHSHDGLAALDDAIYFTGLEFRDTVGDRRVLETLWRSDGTPAGTVAVRVVLEVPISAWNAGLVSRLASRLTAAAGRLFFVVDDGIHGAEPWTSDGTGSGTRLAADLRPGRTGSYPVWLTPQGAGVFFAADDGAHGQELWWSDGTPVGTRLLRDVAPGRASSLPQELAVIDGFLLFAAVDEVHGLEAWRSDGTPAGTTLLADVLPGRRSSAPRSFTVSGDTLYLVAGLPRLGYELWAIDRAAVFP